MPIRFRSWIGVIVLIWPGITYGWYKHNFLMAPVLKKLEADTKKTRFKTPCKADDSKMLESLIPAVQLNPKTKVTEIWDCHKSQTVSIYEILNSTSVDDSDFGMDQNLPDAYDPQNERKWLGGSQGLPSQGFRHMYFGGWKVTRPVGTFQMPIHALGQAPTRTQQLAEKAKELLHSGHRNLAWAYRVLAWSMHYTQDLSQPFHTVQLITVKLGAFSEFFHWPPWDGLNAVISETARMAFNYHLAYEGYVLYQQQKGNKSVFDACLSKPEKFATLKPFSPNDQPLDIALAVSQGSVELATKIGSGLIAFFGEGLKGKDVDIIAQKGVPPFEELSVRADMQEPRDQVNQLTCQALANGALGTQRIIEWATQL